MEDLRDRKLEDLRKLDRSNPGKTGESLLGRIKALETKIERARELFIDGDLPRPEYEGKKALIQDEIEAVQEELSKVDNLDAEIRRVEALRQTLLSVESPLSGHYALTSLPEDPNVLEDDDVAYGSKETAAKRRQSFYQQVGMRVGVGEEPVITLGVRKLGSASGSTATGTMYPNPPPTAATTP
jgi:hypothetical protein